MNGANIINVPTGVKIISVLYFIGAAFLLFLGIISIIGGATMGSAIASFIPFLGFLGAGLFIVLGLVLIGLGILYIFVGRGLWRAKNWARIVAVILGLLNLVLGLVGMAGGSISGNIIGVVLNLVIVGYLLFSPKVKSVFV